MQYVTEAKACVAMLGGVEALIALLKRVMRRYQVRQYKCVGGSYAARLAASLAPELETDFSLFVSACRTWQRGRQ